MTCKPWCDTIARLGDSNCNCLQSGQKLMRADAIKPRIPRDCTQWRPIATGSCMCGLPWYMHSNEARGGFVSLLDYKKAAIAKNKQATMSNEDAAEWVISMGDSNEERVEKVKDLLANKSRDGLSREDEIFLEQALKVLQNYDPKASKKSKSRLHPCIQCGKKYNARAGRLCAPCEEAAVDEADNAHIVTIVEELNKQFD